LLSGRRPPHLTKEDFKYHTLPDEGLIQKLIELGGIPTEVMQFPELIELVLPTIRADFQIIETWESSETSESSALFSVSMPIITLAGKRDKRAEPADLEQWRSYTKSTFEIHEFEGGHFFLSSLREDVMELVRSRLIERGI
jgi:surfactin synthase thioesterase subunit